LNSSQQDVLHEALEVAWRASWSKRHGQGYKLSLPANKS
jgi:hypothetical protein